VWLASLLQEREAAVPQPLAEAGLAGGLPPAPIRSPPLGCLPLLASPTAYDVAIVTRSSFIKRARARQSKHLKLYLPPLKELNSSQRLRTAIKY
jgi:hypothetical protein